MVSADRPDGTAARWRGGLVGACSATVSAGAHGIGGGMLPGGAALVLMILGCAVVGVAAGGALGRGVGAVAAFLVAGQAVGHLTLTLAAGHPHGLELTPAMLVAHLMAAAVLAALICTAERLWSALSAYVWRLVRALTGAAPADQARTFFPEAVSGTPRTQLGCTAGTRGPPLSFA